MTAILLILAITAVALLASISGSLIRLAAHHEKFSPEPASTPAVEEVARPFELHEQDLVTVLYGSSVQTCRVVEAEFDYERGLPVYIMYPEKSRV